MGSDIKSLTWPNLVKIAHIHLSGAKSYLAQIETTPIYIQLVDTSCKSKLLFLSAPGHDSARDIICELPRPLS